MGTVTDFGGARACEAATQGTFGWAAARLFGNNCYGVAVETVADIGGAGCH
jgi:hypothetical protein